MPCKKYLSENINTNVRCFFNYARHQLKLKGSQYTSLTAQETDQKDSSIIINSKNESEKNPQINPFQQDGQRTDFISRMIEKVNLDMFNHLF